MGHGGRLPTLTGLRAVAAGLVFARHGYVLVPPAAQEAWLRVFGIGLVGVSFFFLLSGFVLAWTYRAGDTPGGFYRRRVARIAPNHLTVCGVAFLVAVVTYGLSPTSPNVFPVFALFQAWLPHPAFYYGINSVEWSLSCEVAFYLALPLYVAPLARNPRARRLAGVAAVVVVFLLPVVLTPDPARVLGGGQPDMAEWAVYNLPAARAAEFLLGVVLALEMRAGWRPRLPWRPALAVAAVAVTAAGVAFSPFSITAVTLLPFAAVIVAAADADRTGAGTVFARRTWQRLGEWSFAFYLLHLLTLRGVAAAVPGGHPAVLLLISLAVAVALSAAVYRWVERPCERLLRAGPSAERRGVQLAYMGRGQR